MSSTLIIIPCFNERDNIAALIEALLVKTDADILIVDDSSPDGTAEEVRRVQAIHPDRVFLKVRQGKGGRGSAVLDGFRFALAGPYQLIFEMDADFSHHPDDIGKFFEAIKTADCVIGSRYLPGSKIEEWGPKRTFFSKWANVYARLVLHIPISDYTNGYRCYTRSAVEAIDLDRIDAKGYVVLSEVAYQLHRKGKTFADVPVHFVNRRRGISNLSSHEISEAFFSVLRVRSPRLHMHVKQGIGFVFAGGIGACIDLGTLTLLVRSGIASEIPASILSTSLSVVWVFFANKYVAFKHRKGNASSQGMKFAFTYGMAYLLNIGLSSLFITIGIHYLLSKILAIFLVMFWNYFLLHSFVFKHNEVSA